MFPKSRNHLRLKLHLFFTIWGIRKFRDSQPKSTKPATRKTKNNLKCSTSHLVSNEVSRKCKKPSGGTVVLVFVYDFKCRINRHQVNCRFFLKRFSVSFNLFVFLFLVTPCLAVAVQSGME